MSEKKTKRRIATIIAILLLLLWWWWPTDPFAKVHELQAELFGNDGAVAPEQRQAKFAELRSEISKLTPEQRAHLASERQKRMRDRMSHYSEMTAEQKKAFLDQQIDQSLQSQQQSPRGGWGGGGAGSGPPAATPDDKEKRRQERLDSTTPEFRAQMDQFRHDMAQRRQERGLPPGRG